MEEYTEHFRGIYTSDKANDAPAEFPPIAITNPPTIDDITTQLLQYIPKLKNRKAPGPDNITNEILKHFSVRATKNLLSPIILAATEHGLLPAVWRSSNVKLLWKNKGSSSDVAMHRPIALTSNVRKLAERIILQKMIDSMKPLHPAQCGFRHNTSTADASLLLSSIFEQQNSEEKPLYVAFLDIKAAFDTVDRSILWPILARYKLPHPTIEIIKRLFDFNCSQLLIQNAKSDPIPLGTGLLQGSILSPVLYAYFINDLIYKLEKEHTNPVTLINKPLASLWFADDSALIAQSPEDLQGLLNICSSHSVTNNYKYAPQKSAILMNKYGDKDAGSRLTLYNSPIPLTQNFKYLGSFFDSDGFSPDIHIHKMINKSQVSVAMLQSCGFTPKTVSITTLLDLVQLICHSQLTFSIHLLPRIQSSKYYTLLDKRLMNNIVTLLHLNATTSHKGLFAVLNVLPSAKLSMIRKESYARRMRNTSNDVIMDLFKDVYCYEDGSTPRHSALHNPSYLTKCTNANESTPPTLHTLRKRFKTNFFNEISTKDTAKPVIARLMLPAEVGFTFKRQIFGRQLSYLYSKNPEFLSKLKITDTDIPSLPRNLVRHFLKWKLNGFNASSKQCPYKCQPNADTQGMLTQHHLALCLEKRNPQVFQQLREKLPLNENSWNTQLPGKTTTVDTAVSFVVYLIPSTTTVQVWFDVLNILKIIFDHFKNDYFTLSDSQTSTEATDAISTQDSM